MKLKTFLLEFFTWWNGQTMGTRFLVSRQGEFVGEDQFGNKYYRQRNGDRRWVIYNGEAEASRVPPGWHGWLAGRVDTAPSEEEYRMRDWEKPHLANTTGIAPRNMPPGSLSRPNAAAASAPDYQAWKPE